MSEGHRGGGSKEIKSCWSPLLLVKPIYSGDLFFFFAVVAVSAPACKGAKIVSQYCQFPASLRGTGDYLLYRILFSNEKEKERSEPGEKKEISFSFFGDLFHKIEAKKNFYFNSDVRNAD